MADDRLARRGGGAAAALAREDARLHDMLSSLQPDIVVGCHPDPVRRAALAAWCAERQRVWIDIATLQPQAPPSASAGATLRVLLPTLHGPADGTGAAPPSSRELFDDLPLPGPYVPHAALRLATLSTYLTLQRHVARAAVNAVMDLLRGRAPPAIRICVQTAPAGRNQRCIVEELESDGDGDDYMPWAGTPAADARVSAAH
ncbi:MAG: hypothetical protein A3E25_12440 [Burkholderiales bacterium RIFCSPHIGHO2_12_FULL_69_20]|nr:MAG: hypothetical protein A3E25_12440 [Burkholderiales bacterium RIFCSPHIGHO2_12_FULL_69_20]